MKTKFIKPLLLFTGVLFYNFCFWNESAGFNVLLFTAVILPLVFAFSPLLIFNRSAWVVAAGCLLSAIMCVVFNSNASVLGVIASFILLNGFAVAPASKFIPVALANGVLNSVLGPWNSFNSNNAVEQLEIADRKPSRWLILSIVPIIVVMVFFFIFYAANPDFAGISDKVFTAISDAFERFFKYFSWLHLWFLVLGTIIIAGFLFKKAIDSIYNWERTLHTHLEQNSGESMPLDIFGLGRLSDETKAGFIMLVMVNLLVLVVNIIDIKTQWFGFKYHEGMNLANNVHEGTGLLIFSILLAMAILLYLFRGNQNFTEQSPKLKQLAYAWVFQNALLCVSVALRNYHYIENFGLAYKRIGVLFFLMLTLFGLITMVMKISHNRPANFLFRYNSWAAYMVLIVIGCCNWDLLIANYNLTHHYRILEVPSDSNYDVAIENDRYVDHTDRYYLLSLSDKSLQAFLQHPEFLTDSIYTSNNNNLITVKQQFNERVNEFLKRKEREDFLSWNLAESNTYEAIKQKYTKP